MNRFSNICPDSFYIMTTIAAFEKDIFLQLDFLKSFENQKLSVLDIGSEKSPIAWFLATRNFRVIISDISPNYWRVWQKARHKLKVDVERRILDAQHLDLPTASLDIYLSVSVLGRQYLGGAAAQPLVGLGLWGIVSFQANRLFW